MAGYVMQVVAFRAAFKPTARYDFRRAVSITAPTSGATMTGTATVNVSARMRARGWRALCSRVDGIPRGDSP